MAVVTNDFLSALFTNFRVIWEDAFLAAQAHSPYSRYCTEVPSTTDQESYNWLGTVPKMQEWLDERRIQGLGNYTYSIRNKHYEATLEVDRNTLEDDRYGLIRPRIEQLAQEAARYPTERAIDVLVDGTSGLAYDGVAYFSASHTEEDSGTQSNLNTGAGTTLANIRTDFIEIRTSMRRVKDGRGRPMNIMPDCVLIPPDLQDVFEQLINTNMIALSSGTQQSNVLQGAADIIVESYLTDTSDWYAFCTKFPIKPLICQMRKAPEFVSLDDVRSEPAFRRRMFQYGVDTRFNVGYGLWQMAVKVNN